MNIYLFDVMLNHTNMLSQNNKYYIYIILIQIVYSKSYA
jgi:hypothetical protein